MITLQKLEMESLAGVSNVAGSIELYLQNFKITKQLQPLQSSHFIDIKSSVCMKQETDCPCECPGRANCEEKNGIKRCLQCLNSYCSSPCPPGTVEQYNLKQNKVECKCRCADFSLRDNGNSGDCKVYYHHHCLLFMHTRSIEPIFQQCGCTCQDGTESTIGPDGQCDCSCKCRNCQHSTRGPSGCICLNDK